MEGKVDKTIVKSILVAFGIIAAICIITGIIVNILNKQANDSYENNERKASCMNSGKCFINGECVECDSNYVDDSETTKKGAAESSALWYIDEVEKQVLLAEIDEDTDKIEAGTYTVKQLYDLGVEAKDERPYSSGTVVINSKGAVEEAMLEFDGYNVYYDGKYVEASEK